jgi:hypothetical protein
VRLVIIESPFAGDVERNVAYARDCMRDCLGRDEAPMAGHLLYTQVLDDTVSAERSLGIEAHIAWGRGAQATVVYTDLGLSDGMRLGIDAAHKAGRPIEYRSLREFDDEATRNLR